MLLWPRALAYMVFVGAGWLIVIPAGILYLEQGLVRPTLSAVPLLVFGSLLFSVGALLAFSAGYHLITFGDGTPFPLEPTRRLVTSGPYGYVRNPQGVAILLMTLGLVLSVQSVMLWLMLPLTILSLEVLVGPYEDRSLERRFDNAYRDYKSRVRKWIPRLHR